MKESFVSIQATISKAFIQRTIESQLKSILGSDGLAIEVPPGSLLIENVDNVQYQVSNHEIIVAADIEIEYHKEEGINLTGQGTIHLVMVMAYEIKPDFTFSTTTRLQEHQWIEKPSLKIGKFKISTKAALNVLIKSFDEKLGKEIDTQLAKRIDLQKIVTEQLNKFSNPIPNNYDPNIHLSIRPDNLLFNIAEQGGVYGLAAHTSFQAEINWDKRSPEKIFATLPHIQEFDGQSSASEINIPVKVDYQLLTALLAKQFAQVKIMEEDLQIKDLQLEYKNKLLHVGANIKGGISGALKASLSPRLDKENQKIHLEQLDYEIKSSSFLVKAAVFLFKGKIDKKIENFTTIELRPIFDKMVKDFNTKLSEINIEGITFELTMTKVELMDFLLLEDHFACNVKVSADGQLS